ncbi:DUF4747 family protein [Saccharophagus degradans]|uniref:DUF4747 family protein n=1 Tax=Saccharophagus degradans TaxID=86304 RepID=UPI002477D0E8|nr:DUF4747 family protein [Saccharophagus degradans]WGO97842.1 DUF4747 family protein [Saccharophagus degradans]
MAKEKKVVIGVLNVTMQPHSPEKYLELFRDTYKLRRPANIAGDSYGLLSAMAKVERYQEEPGPLTGDIFKFTQIDKNADWFDTSANDFASEDQLGKINIPDNLKPNSSRFTYIFYPKEHLFFYEAYYDGNSFGPTNMERFVSRLFQQEEIEKIYGKIDVTHVPAVDTLVDALKIPRKERIDIFVKRPNPDDHAEAERRVMERMNARNIESFEQSYKVVPGQSIEVDEELETMAHIAAKNGSFAIKGKDHRSKPISYSTKQHPYTVTEYYDPDGELVFDLLSTITTQLKSSIAEWFRK